MAILISGGRLTSESTKKVEDFIKNRIKGRENFHSVMILEAEPAAHAALDSANARMKIEIVPLTDAQQSDALFQNYDERSIDKVGMAFRLPRLLRGDVRDFNRATADAALEFSEMQVFSPEREDFDWLMNRKILTDLNIKFWTFASNAPTTRDPLDLAEIVTAMVKNSILVPEEARDLAKAIFNKDFKKIDEIWTKIPPELLKVGILPEGEGGQFLDGPDDEGGEVSEEPPDDNEEAPEGEGAEVERSGKGGDKGAAKRRRGRSTDKNREGSDGFTKIPKRLVAARYQKATGRRGLMKLARDLVDLRSMLDQAERSALIDEGKTVRKAENEEPPKEVIKVSAEEWSRMIETVDE